MEVVWWVAIAVAAVLSWLVLRRRSASIRWKWQPILALIPTAAMAVESVAIDQGSWHPEAVARVREHRLAYRLPGVVVTVVLTGSRPWSFADGYADIEDQVPISQETVLPVGSLSKTITATLLIREAAAGRFDLDRPANEYLAPAFAIKDSGGSPTNTTLAQIMTHTSGLPASIPGLGFGRFHDATPDELLHDLAIANEPGTYTYSNLGYALLGHLAAAAAETSFPDYAQGALFSKIGMESSSFHEGDRVPIDFRERLGVCYRSVGGEVTAVHPGSISPFRPAAGLWTSGSDLARLAAYLLQPNAIGNITSEQLRRTFFESRYRPLPGHSHGRSLVFETREAAGSEIAWQSGDRNGCRARLTLVPDLSVGISVLSNTDSFDAINAITYSVLEAITGSMRSEVEPISEDHSKAFSGRYVAPALVPAELSWIRSFFELNLSPEGDSIIADPFPFGTPFRIVQRGGRLEVMGGAGDGNSVHVGTRELFLGLRRWEKTEDWMTGRPLAIVAAATIAGSVAATVLILLRWRSSRRPRRR